MEFAAEKLFRDRSTDQRSVLYNQGGSMNLFKRLLCRLLNIRLPIDRAKTTKHFEDFKKYYQEEDRKVKRSDSDENYLLRYIFETKLSPFEGDDNKEEARKFLVEEKIPDMPI